MSPLSAAWIKRPMKPTTLSPSSVAIFLISRSSTTSQAALLATAKVNVMQSEMLNVRDSYAQCEELTISTVLKNSRILSLSEASRMGKDYQSMRTDDEASQDGERTSSATH